MGDKLLKKALIILVVSVNILFASIPTKESINTLVEDIKPPRTGLEYKSLVKLRNPFLFRKPDKVKSSKDESGKIVKTTVKGKVIKKRTYRRSKRVKTFKLYAILNKSAKINEKWVNLNRKYGKYTLQKITKAYVTLQKGTDKPITVYLNSKNQNIKLLTK